MTASEGSTLKLAEPFVIKDPQSQLTLRAIPYIHPVGAAGGGDQKDGIFIALCLEFDDAAAAARFAKEHEYDPKRIGYKDEGDKGVKTPDNCLFLEGACCAGDVLSPLFTFNIKPALERLKVSEATIDKLWNYYNDEAHQVNFAWGTSERSLNAYPGRS